MAQHPASKYKDSFPAEMIALAALGNSMVQIAAKFGVSKSTLLNWAKDPMHPEFMEAYQVARTCHEAYWEDLGQKGTRGMIKGFNASSWSKLMSVRHQDDWVDRSAQKIELQNEVSTMTNQEIDEALKALLAAREINKAKQAGGTPPVAQTAP